MKKPFWFAGCMTAVSAGVSAQAADIILQPVRASGVHTIAGTEIRLVGGGQRVFLEVKLRDFAPHLLRAYQMRPDSAGYSNGAAGELTPAVQSCPSAGPVGDRFCRTILDGSGPGGPTCLDRDPGPGTTLACEAGWINRSRADWVFRGHDALSFFDDSTADYRFGATAIRGDDAADNGSIYYAGTLALDAPADALGTYTIGFIVVDQAETFLLEPWDESSRYIEPLHLTGATITVLCASNAVCDDGNACTEDSCDTNRHECVYVPVDGLECEDGNSCTVGTVCHQGICGTPVTCANGDQCNDSGACIPDTGECWPPVPKPIGSPCDDGDPCTVGDFCRTGRCRSGDFLLCTNGDQCHDAGTCNPQTGQCSAPVPKINGTACNDGDGCTNGDACIQGECIGTDIPNCIPWNAFALCLDGPDLPAESVCLAFDLTGDGFVDLSDVALMIPSQTGP